MATKIVTKNSSTASAVPTASDLVQGELAVNVADKRLFTEDNGGSIVELGTNPSTLTVTGEITANGGIALGDNDKATFGDSDDLQIYHDGVNSYIADVGAGDLNISAGNDLRLQDSNGLSYFKGGENGASKIYYAGAEKLATTSTGIDVTGTATMDGLVVEGAGAGLANFYRASANANFSAITFKDTTNTNINAKIGWNANELRLDGTNSVRLVTDAKNRLLVTNNGDISFYEDTGTTPKLFWDASAESLGIGTSSPDTGLDVATTNYTFAGTTYDIYGLFGDTSGGIRLGADSSNDDSVIGTTGTNDLQFVTYNGSSWGSRMTLSNTGNVGIGTTSPSSDISSSSTVLEIADSNVASLALNNTTQSTKFEIASVDVSGGALSIRDNNAERMRIDSSGNVGIGTSSPSASSANVSVLTLKDGATFYGYEAGGIGISGLSVNFDNIGNTAQYKASSKHVLQYTMTDTTGVHAWSSTASTGTAGATATLVERMRIDSSGNVGIGTSSPSVPVHVYKSQASPTIVAKFENPADEAIVEIKSKNTDLGVLQFADTEDANVGAVQYSHSDNSMRFKTNDSERMRIDSAGNLLVGTTSGSLYNTTSNTGIQLDGTNANISVARSNNRPMDLNRLGSDGDILQFRKDGAIVGSIGSRGGEFIAVGSGDTFLEFNFGSDQINPSTGSAARDNAIDLGSSGARFDDIYATNGTIQTSDRNEKQDIEALSDAEQRVAVACKGLLRKFRWKDSVAEKGDEARTHFGIIAQDLQAAFAAEGLDAGDYAMFISTTWTDEETNEEKTRMGVRYSELLAFIISAI